MFNFGAGRKFCEEIAEHLGVNSTLYRSALMEVGITWKHFKLLKEDGCSVDDAAEKLIPQFSQGLSIIKEKFGPQYEIIEGEAAILNRPQKKNCDDEDMDLNDMESLKLLDDFKLLEYAIREAQASLLNGFPVEARGILSGVLPENVESHANAKYVLNHKDL